MASIHKLDKSRFWYAFYRDATGIQKGVSTKIPISPDAPDAKTRATLAAENKRKAQAIADQLETAVRGDRVGEQLKRILTRYAGDKQEELGRSFTIKGMLARWLDNVSTQKSAGTYVRYKGTAAGFLSYLGTTATAPASTVTCEIIEDWVNSMLRDGLAASTVKIHVKTLNIPFSIALKRGQIGMNPCAGVTLRDATSESRDPFTPQEVRALLDAAPSRDWRTCILIAATTGLRLADVTELKWSNVDLLEAVIKVRPRKTASKKRDLLLPLHPTLREHLLRLPAPENPDAPVMPELQGKAVGGRSGLSLTFRAIMNAAGIECSKQEGKGQGRAFHSKGFHSLRHFFISEMARGGIASELRMKLSGHSTATAHATYSHETFDQLQKAVSVVKI